MNQNNCPQCGSLVSDELPGGLCPACLMAAAQHTRPDIAATNAPRAGFQPPNIPDMSQLFPELEIIELIGRGGMGAVYKARQKNLDRIVALKIFLRPQDDVEIAARFQQEARALAKLNHPNIVTVYDFGTRSDTHFLIMEYIDGLNLRQLVSEEKLSPELALQMVPQLCDALQYAHDNGVIHRDIKPENLLLDVDGKINIADFGLAKLTGGTPNGRLTHTQQVMGTLNYMAPEQRERPTEVDHRADIYSLGVVIYEMLTGELPIGRFQPPSDKSDIDKRLDEVVMRALAKEPERRYQQVSQFKTGFESMESAPVAAAGPIAAATHEAAAFAATPFAADPYTADREPTAPVKSAHKSQPKRGSRWMFTVMSGREKKGNWQPGSPQVACTLMGGTELDLTNVKQKEVNLVLFTLMGGVDVIVPRGASVDVDGFILMGATSDEIPYSDAPETMKVRINSWGAMGGCEIRTAPETRVSQKSQEAIAKYHETGDHQMTFAGGIVLLYKIFAMLVTIMIPIIFMMGPAEIMPNNSRITLGILVAIAAGFIWAGQKYVRVIVGAGPEDKDDESVREYFTSSKLGSFVRIIALFFGFACASCFIIANDDIFPENTCRLAGIISALLCGVLFAIAGYVEEFVYGKTP